MAMPKASNEASLTVGSVSLTVCKWHSRVLNCDKNSDGDT